MSCMAACRLLAVMCIPSHASTHRPAVHPHTPQTPPCYPLTRLHTDISVSVFLLSISTHPATQTPMNISIQAIALDEAHNALLVCVRNGEAMLCSLDRLRAQMNPVQEHTLDDNKYRWDHRPVAADAPPLAPHIQFLPASVALVRC